jgi:hypothetical protein
MNTSVEHENARKHTTFRSEMALLTALSNVLGDELRKVDPLGPESTPNRDHLRSLGAMSTLLVRNHEVTAVATNISDRSWNEKQVEVDESGVRTIKYFATANPRSSGSRAIEDDTLTYRGDNPTKFVFDPGCALSVEDPLPYLQKSW